MFWKCLNLKSRFFQNVFIFPKCFVFHFCLEGTFDAYQRTVNSQQFSTDNVLSPSPSSLGSYGQQLVWALSAVVALFIIGSMVFLWERKTQRRSSPKLLQNVKSSSLKRADSENEPLIAQHFDALRYLWCSQTRWDWGFTPKPESSIHCGVEWSLVALHFVFNLRFVPRTTSCQWRIYMLFVGEITLWYQL